MKNKLRTITAFILLLALVISFVPVAHAASVGELPTENLPTQPTPLLLRMKPSEQISQVMRMLLTPSK